MGTANGPFISANNSTLFLSPHGSFRAPTFMKCPKKHAEQILVFAVLKSIWKKST